MAGVESALLMNAVASQGSDPQKQEFGHHPIGKGELPDLVKKEDNGSVCVRGRCWQLGSK
jgi:hypothetical protein